APRGDPEGEGGAQATGRACIRAGPGGEPRGLPLAAAFRRGAGERRGHRSPRRANRVRQDNGDRVLPVRARLAASPGRAPAPAAVVLGGRPPLGRGPGLRTRGGGGGGARG